METVGPRKVNTTSSRPRLHSGPVKSNQIDVAQRVLILGAGLVLSICIGEALLGAFIVPLAGDEEIHVRRLQTLFQFGYYVPGEFMESNQPAAGVPLATPYVYGPVFSLLAHAANTAVGNETWGTPAYSGAATDLRHLFVVGLAIWTATAVGILARLFTGSLALGIWAAAALFAVPEWLGDSFYNIKDIPVAAGYTLLSLGLVLGLINTGKHQVKFLTYLGIAGLVGCGIGLTVGVRSAFWLPVGVTLVIFVTLVLIRSRTLRVIQQPSVGAVGMGALAGMLAVILAYPTQVESIREFFTNSISTSGSYPWSSSSRDLVWGMRAGPFPPWWYLPTWFVASVPTGILSLALLGMVGALVRLLKQFRAGAGHRSVWKAKPVMKDDAVMLVLLQAMLLPAGAIMLGSNVYGGIRQFLFVLPALAVLAAVGLNVVRRSLVTRASRQMIRKWGTTVLGVTALIVPVADSVSLFPNNGAYLTPLASIGGIEGKWDLSVDDGGWDHLSHRVPQGESLYCSLHQRKWSRETRPERLEASLGSCPQALIQRYRGAGNPLSFGKVNVAEPTWIVVWHYMDLALPVGCTREGSEWLEWPTRRFEVRLAQLWRCEAQMETGLP